MSVERRTQTGRMVRRVFEILLDHPKGLHIRNIVQLLAASRAEEQVGEVPFSREEIAGGCIAAIKAGWIVNTKDVFALSPAGIDAYNRFKDPAQFMIEAGRSSLQGWISLQFPVAYRAAGTLRDQAVVEYRVAKRLGVRRLMKDLLGRPTPWEDILPLQSPLRYQIDFEVAEETSLVEYLQSLPAVSWGRHAVYIPPSVFGGEAFRAVNQFYPAHAGLKIVKKQGGVENGSYITGKSKGDSLIQLGMVHGHRHLLLVANLLHLRGIGPRLYDLVELEFGGSVWTAYVVEHLEGENPSVEQCKIVIDQLKELEREELLEVILPDGFDDEEFECPRCSGNTLTNLKGDCKYVDFQNFRLCNYQAFLTSLAAEAATSTHFGDRLLIRGGRYLYQSVPGVKLPGKRNIEDRIVALVHLMEAAKVSTCDRMVLDIGCNIGMMMAQYLKLGARWCHGWDRAQIVPFTEELLLALGCTRFSVTGGDLSKDYFLEGDLPSFLVPALDGCIISYLAIRGHLGWLDSLSRIRWSCLIYEGHEGESHADLEQHIAELQQMINCEVAGVSNYVDGDSEQRAIALLLRK